MVLVMVLLLAKQIITLYHVVQKTLTKDQHALIIPLRAEFWNGSDFVVNTDDDKSTFNGANYCKQVTWHCESKTTTNALFNGSGTVSDGEDDINASQNTPIGADSPREQARLWLRMEDDNPSKKTGENDISCLGSNEGQPWLRYNWRQRSIHCRHIRHLSRQ
jgi:MSHA biogenesis protein MshQ